MRVTRCSLVDERFAVVTQRPDLHCVLIQERDREALDALSQCRAADRSGVDLVGPSLSRGFLARLVAADVRIDGREGAGVLMWYLLRSRSSNTSFQSKRVLGWAGPLADRPCFRQNRHAPIRSRHRPRDGTTACSRTSATADEQTTSQSATSPGPNPADRTARQAETESSASVRRPAVRTLAERHGLADRPRRPRRAAAHGLARFSGEGAQDALDRVLDLIDDELRADGLRSPPARP
jgi:hypothetical protein